MPQGEEEAPSGSSDSSPLPFSQLLNRWEEEPSSWEEELSSSRPSSVPEGDEDPFTRVSSAVSTEQSAEASASSAVPSEAKASTVSTKAKASTVSTEAKPEAKGIIGSSRAKASTVFSKGKEGTESSDDDAFQASSIEAPTDERHHKYFPVAPTTDGSGVSEAAAVGIQTQTESDKVSSDQDWDSLNAVRNKVPRNYPPQVVVPVRNKLGRTEAITTEEAAQQPDPTSREPGGHRLQEDYNRPPPHFRTARRRIRPKEQERPPSIDIAPSRASGISEKLLLPDYHHKRLVHTPGTTSPQEPPSLAVQQPYLQKTPPPMKISQERWRSARDCDGVAPQEDMYPTKRVAVDSPGDKLGTEEETLARPVAVAEHIAALRTMKHHSKELQELLNVYEDDNDEGLIKSTAEQKKDRQTTQWSASSNRNGANAFQMTPQQPPSQEHISQLEEDMRTKQVTHEKLVQLMAASQKVKTATTPQEQLLKSLEADMLREQLEYDSLMEQVNQLQMSEGRPYYKADPPPSHSSHLAYGMTSKARQDPQQTQQRTQLYYTKRLARAMGDMMDESRPFDEVEDDDLAAGPYPLPPDPPAATKLAIDGVEPSSSVYKEEQEQELEQEDLPPIATVDVFAPQPKSAPEMRPETAESTKKVAETKSQRDSHSKHQGTAKALFTDDDLNSSNSQAIFRPKAKRQTIIKGVEGKLVPLVINRGWERAAAPQKRESDRWKQILSASNTTVEGISAGSMARPTAIPSHQNWAELHGSLSGSSTGTYNSVIL